MSTSVWAVVVTWNRRALLEQCLAHLIAQTRHCDGVVVVDNASDCLLYTSPSPRD